MQLRQGVLGIKVKIMLPWDSRGKRGPKKPLPDHGSIVEPKDEILSPTPILEEKGGRAELPALPQHATVSLAAGSEPGCCSIKTFSQIFKRFKKIKNITFIKF